MAKTTRLQIAGSGRAKAARRSAAEWAEEVAAWKCSGKTAPEYARVRGISAATLTWWSCRGSTGRAPSVVTVPPTTPRAEPRGFLPLRVTTPVEDTPQVEAEIVLVGGRRVRVSGALTFGQLARLLQIVEEGRTC